MPAPTENLQALIGDIRRCFWLLGAASDEMLLDLDLTASLRAVLEHLSQTGPQTVPQIAREKAVKRQSIQALVDQLIEKKLVEAHHNPAHRRSVLIALTPEGKACFKKIQAREGRYLSALAADLDAREVGAAASVLTSLRTSLRKLVQGETHE